MILKDDHMLPAEVCLLGEISGGDAGVLQSLKTQIRPRESDGLLHVIYMDDEIAVVERSFIIEIADHQTRELIGAPPVDALPPAFRSKGD